MENVQLTSPNVILDPDEVRRLNEAARQFAAGINFSLKTDDLAPLNASGISTAAADLSNSTSEDSSMFSSKTDYKSEALRLRVKVTALEEEVRHITHWCRCTYG